MSPPTERSTTLQRLMFRQGKYNGRVLIFASGMVVALMLLIHLGQPTGTGLWFNAFFDALHVPVFAAIALCIFIIAAKAGIISTRQRLLATAAGVLFLSCVSEAIQIPGPRDASFADLVADWLGAAGALFLLHAVGRRALWLRVANLLLGVTVLGIATMPLIVASAAMLERNYQQPVLLDFGARFQTRFVRLQHSILIPAGRTPDGHVTNRVVLGKGPWPGLILHDIWPDWREFSTLVIEAGVESLPEITLHVRIHDEKHQHSNQEYADRFNTTIVLVPGQNEVRIPLDAVRNAPASRELNMGKISSLIIFGTINDAGREFSLSQIRLE